MSAFTEGNLFNLHPKLFQFEGIRICKMPNRLNRRKFGKPTKGIRLRVVNQSLGGGWKLGDIDTDSLQEKFKLWLAGSKELWKAVTDPLTKSKENEVQKVETKSNTHQHQEEFLLQQTINSRTPNGNLSMAAIISVEEFSRLNGMSGSKMQKMFRALAPDVVSGDPRNLVEFCCFRYLSRASSDIHPSLKELAFQRLVFITMLAWQHPYEGRHDASSPTEFNSLLEKTVGEEAFVRLAPAIPGVADRATAHHLFKALVGNDHGLSLTSWMSYLSELIRVHKGRETYQLQENNQTSGETILCTGSSKKKPVLKWEKNIGWPGRLTLTDQAMYFEALGLSGYRKAIRFDLARYGTKMEKARVGPMSSQLFDSAITIVGPGSEKWTLEFVDFGGEMRRDIWHAFISEVISVHKFIHEYGPEDGDASLRFIYGSYRGRKRAIRCAANSILRLQSLQFLKKCSLDPIKLVQFSYLYSSSYGDIVLQALAVRIWGGPFTAKFATTINKSAEGFSLNDTKFSVKHIVDTDGSVYLRKWMRSQSWDSRDSINFWKNAPARQRLVLARHLVVGGLCPLERASLVCRQRNVILEKTQATIDAAMIKGIPSNIDLMKEILLPFAIMSRSFNMLRCWKDPMLTLMFLAFAYTIILRNLLGYIFPTILLVTAVVMLALRSLKLQGRLGRNFGTIMIRDQPPSSTIQKFVALKEAINDLEIYLQKLNVILLKIRSIFLTSDPKTTTEVAGVFLLSAVVLYAVPFRYVLAFLLTDTFTRELEFRKKMILRFRKILQERWATIPVTPVVLLPHEVVKSEESDANSSSKDTITLRG